MNIKARPQQDSKPNQAQAKAKLRNVSSRSVGVGRGKRKSANVPFKFKPVNEYFIAKPSNLAQAETTKEAGDQAKTTKEAGNNEVKAATGVGSAQS